jgi:hypothetical protein
MPSVRVLPAAALLFLSCTMWPAASEARQIDDKTARVERKLPAVRAAGAITIDGALDEAAWAGAPPAHGFVQNDPREGEPATDDTDVRVLYDANNIYIGVFARDGDPQSIITSELTKDFDREAGDDFEIVLDSFNGRFDVGGFYDGEKESYTVGAAVRLHGRLTASITESRNLIRLRAGQYTTDLITARIEYGFSTIAFANALLQSNTDAREWTSNLRCNVIHHRLSDLFLVFNERRDSTTGGLLDRALVAKMTYMMAF